MGDTGDGISRRSFLGQVAAVPLAVRLEERLMAGTSSAPRVVVIGAGAFGVWTALHLRRLGASVTLVDAWGAGNTRSSSGGETRVIRAIYGKDRIYVEMVRRAYELWRQLDDSTDETLYVETGCLWMHRGDDAYVRSSVGVLAELGFPVEQVPRDEAARRYPQINLDGVKSLWLERRAGALSARRGCVAARDEFTKAGGVFRLAQAAVPNIESEKYPSLRLSDGSSIAADAFVFACGPWLGRLFPEVVGEAVRPTRQEVFYFGTPEGSDRYAAARMPVWIDFGERIFYGIPDVHGRGFKVADDTRGEEFDPTSGDRTPSAPALARARQLLQQRFPELGKAPLLASAVCQYENSPDGHLIMDRHPLATNVWLLGGGSGHGYKLSPAVGEMTAQAIMSGKALPEMFAIERLASTAKPKTQFDSQ